MEKMSTINRNFMTELRDLIHSIYDFDENYFKSPKGRLKSKKLSNDELKRLKEFIRMVLETGFVTDETRIYLSNKDFTLDDVKLEMERVRGKECNRSTIQSKMWADKNKFIRFFSAHILRELTSTGLSEERVADIEETIREVEKKYAPKNRLNKIALPLDKIKGRADRISAEEFMDFVKTVAPYSRQNIKFVCESINPDAVEYCRHLLSESDLSDEEIEHKTILLDLLV